MALTNVAQGWKLKKVTATGKVLDAGEIFGGMFMPTAGTSTTVTLYDDSTAAAASLIVATTAALTAGQYVSPIGGVAPITVGRDLAEGVILARGLYVTVGGTGSPVFWVLYK